MLVCTWGNDDIKMKGAPVRYRYSLKPCLQSTHYLSQDGCLTDDLPAELRRRGGGGKSAAGLPPLLDRLQEAAAQRRGTAEELATLFVALLRAASCLTRLVRCGSIQGLRSDARVQGVAAKLSCPTDMPPRCLLIAVPVAASYHQVCSMMLGRARCTPNSEFVNV